MKPTDRDEADVLDGLLGHGAVQQGGRPDVRPVFRRARLDVVEWSRELGAAPDLRAELKSWARSRAVRHHVDAALLGARVDARRGVVPAEAPRPGAAAAPGLATSTAALLADATVPCRCRDCEAATSPLAYLADLLKYCSESVERAGGVVDFAALADALHQPFAELPTECGAVDAPIRQVRIAVEVLRARLLRESGSRRMAAARERAHVARVYEALLRRLGVDAAELRLAAVGAPAERAALAARLGIDDVDVTRGGTTRSSVQWLALDTAAAPLDELETALEERYGFGHTAVDPVPRLSRPAPASLLLDWRRAALRRRWLAEDAPSAPPWDAQPFVDPDLLGPDDFRAPLAANPAFALWQRRRAWVDAQLAQFAALPAPVTGGRIDASLAAMSPAAGGAADYVPAHGVAAATPSWAAPSPAGPALDVLFAQAAELVAPDRARVDAATALLARRFGLGRTAAGRVLELRDRELRHRADARLPPVSPAEHRELVSLLVQARKRLLAATWVAEETAGAAATVPTATRLALGTAQLWAAEREPLDGDWPPLDDGRAPWLDPERVGDADLPDEASGAAARALLAQRRAELAQLRQSLAQARTTGGALDAAIAAAYAAPPLPPGGGTLIARMDATLAELSSADPLVLAAAVQRVADDFALEVDEFRRLATAAAQDRQSLAAARPTAAEVEAVLALLVSARKRRALYAGWRAAERASTGGLAYWQALKARLPAGRASAEDRAAWRRELARRGSLPIVDPDLVGATLLVRAPATVSAPLPADATSADRAALLWQQRRAAIDAASAALRSARLGAASAADAGLGAATSLVGLDLATLASVGARQDAGRPLARRLAQLALTPDSFTVLDRVRRLRAANLTVADADWDEVIAALTEVWKSLRRSAWRAEERELGIALGPDAFRLPESAAAFAAPRFGARLEDRLDWEDRLRVRIELDAAVPRALGDLVAAVEEETLPPLRDDLLLALAPPAGIGASLAARAAAFGDRLLIDLRNSGCALTTRVAQAIETVQNLLFALRTGQLGAAYPDWRLRASASRDFDAVWQWLGSYATWRAAVFVLLYPENVLVPSLRREASPACRELLAETRGGSLTPAAASAAHARFRDYFLDVVSLEQIRATTTGSRWYDERRAFAVTGAVLPQVTFLFAATPAERGRRIYWSAWSRVSGGETRQSWWRPLPQFTEDVAEVLGASVYRTPAQRRYLYLVVRTAKDQANHLWFLRFALDGDGTWDPQATQLLPAGAQSLPERFDALLLRTGEADVPRVRVTDPTRPGMPLTLYLDQRGVSGSVVPQSVGRPEAWSDATELAKIAGSGYSLPSAASIGGLLAGLPAPIRLDEVAPAGVATVVAADGAVHAIVSCVVAVRSGASQVPARIPLYRLLRNVGANGAPASATGWMQMPAVDVVGSRVSGGHRVLGGGATWLANPGDPSRGRLLLAASVETDAGFQLRYWVGEQLDLSTGAFGTWRVQGADADYAWAATVGMGFGLAAVPTNAGEFELYALASSPGGAANPATGAAATPARGILRRTTLRADGSLVGGWLEQRQFELERSEARTTAGLGLAAGRLLGSEQSCLVVAWLVDEPSENVAYLKTWTGATWTAAESIVAAPLGPAPGWFGNDSFGLGLALGDVDRDGRLDLLVHHVDRPVGGANVFIRIGRAIGLPAGIAQGDPVPASVKPRYPASSPAPDLEPRPVAELRSIASANLGNTAANRELLAEMLYFVPMTLGLALQRAGHFVPALDWLRTVYDHSRADGADRLYPGLEGNASAGISRPAGWSWLLDPLNPHAIAAGRTDTYRRYTLQATVRCLLDYADAEFTRDTPESLPLAARLYRTALRLLGDPALRQDFAGCDELIDTLTYTYGDKPWVGPVVGAVLGGGRLHVRDAVATFKQRIDAVLSSDAAEPAQYSAVQAIVAEYAAPERSTLGERFVAADHERERALSVLVGDADARSDIEALLLRVGDGVDAALVETFGVGAVGNDVAWRVDEKGLSFGEQEYRLPWTVDDGRGRPFGSDDGPVLPQPEPELPFGDLVGIGGLSVEDLRRYGERYFDVLPGLDPGLHPDIGPTIKPPIVVVEPPRVELAPPVMSILTCVPPNPVLRALTLRAELNLYKLQTCRNIAGLRRHVDLYAAATDARTGLPAIGADGQLSLPGLVAPPPTPYRFRTLLERARNLVQLAQQAEAALLAALQQGDAERYGLLRARQDVRTAQAGVQLQVLRVNEARNGRQLASLQQQRSQVVLAHYDALLGQGALAAETAALVLEATAASIQASAAIAAAFDPTARGQALSLSASAIGSTAGILRQVAAQERQRQDWRFQQSLAREDVGIAAQQALLADDQVRIAGQEQAIAELAVTHDEAVVEFLGRKFTGVELYDWMAEVLQSTYRYFLQQATATARLAAGQLGFERQEAVPPFVQADYWRAEDAGGGPAADRRGLTGSARLLADVTRLEQFAFDTDRPRLELTRTLSIGQLAPLELQRFRETGVLRFATPMELFDREFPGHYLRLVRRVRVSVLALTPGDLGIRATLTAGRTSRVVVGGDTFQTVRVQRGPDSIALSVARDAAGALELAPPAEMLRPFEGIGVDAQWELRMPKAANPFDYGSIADVLFTIDYSALHSYDYEQQVVQALRPTENALRAWSLRTDLADQWYALANPDTCAEPGVVRFATSRRDFPPHLESLLATGIGVHVARRPGARFEIEPLVLEFREAGQPGVAGGPATTVDGRVGSDAAHGAAWAGVAGRAPFGEWVLRFPDEERMHERFRTGEVDDVLVVIGYSGRRPAWPAWPA